MTTEVNYGSRKPSDVSYSFKRRYLKCLPKWSNVSGIVALILLVLVIWAIGYSLFNEVVGINSQLFSLVVSEEFVV